MRPVEMGLNEHQIRRTKANGSKETKSKENRSKENWSRKNRSRKNSFQEMGAEARRSEVNHSEVNHSEVKRAGDPVLETEELHRTARRGFLTAELVIAMAVLMVILSFTLPHLTGIHYGDRVADRVFIHQLKSAILDQRIRAMTDPGRSYSMTLDGTGCVDFKCGASVYRKLSGPQYQVFVQKGVRTDIMSTKNFKNRTWGGQDGFTLGIWKNGQPLANLVFQVGTSTFREEYYGE